MVKSNRYKSPFHNIILKCLLLLFFVQLNCLVSSHTFFMPQKEVLIAQAQLPNPTTGKALQNLVPLLSQEENLLGRRSQEPEKEEEDMAWIHSCSKTIPYA